MKKLFITLLIVPLLSLGGTETTSTSSYCEGWEDGHCEGWKYVKGQFAICPITPICPIPEIDCSSGYKCGYNRGFVRGMKDARK